MTLCSAIDNYLHSIYYNKFNMMLKYYEQLSSIKTVIDDACFGRSVDKDGSQVFSDHYWNTYQLYKDDSGVINRIGGRNKSNWLEWTYKIRKDILDLKNNIENSNHFNEIYDKIYRITQHHNEFDVLFSYDVSLRIGSYLKLIPDSVYLHAGAERGYISIFGKFDSPIVIKDEFVSKNNKFYGLEPHQIENFLCVAKVQGWI